MRNAKCRFRNYFDSVYFTFSFRIRHSDFRIEFSFAFDIPHSSSNSEIKLKSAVLKRPEPGPATITISIKDEKYKLNITDFEREMLSEGKSLAKTPVETTLTHLESGKSEVSKEETDKIYFALKSNINKVALNIIESFKSAMIKKDDF